MTAMRLAAGISGIVVRRYSVDPHIAVNEFRPIGGGNVDAGKLIFMKLAVRHFNVLIACAASRVKR